MLFQLTRFMCILIVSLLLITTSIMCFYYVKAHQESTNNEALQNFANFSITQVHTVDLNCSVIALDENEYNLLDNGSVYLKKYAMTLSESLYHTENNTVSVCKTVHVPRNIFPEANNVPCVSSIGFYVALVALIVQLSVYWYIDNLYNLEKCNTAATGIGLFIISMIIAILQLDLIAEYRNILYTLPTFTHFYLLMSFSWMSIMSNEIIVASSSFAKISLRLRIRVTYTSLILFRCFNGLFVFMGITYLYGGSLMAQQDYCKPKKDKFCWLLMHEPSLTFLSSQVITLLILNVSTFLYDVLYFRKSDFFKPGVQISANCRQEVKDLRLYITKMHRKFFKLSVVFYLTWGIGALSSVPGFGWMYSVFCVIHGIEAIYVLNSSFLFIYNKTKTPCGYKLMFGDDLNTAIRPLTNCNENPLSDIKRGGD